MTPTSRRVAGGILALACIAGGFGFVLRAERPQDVGSWAPGGPTPQARTGAAAVALPDGRTLILAGRGADEVVTERVVVFDPRTNLFAEAGQLLAPRVGHSATLLRDGRVVVAGGSVGSDISAEIEIFDPATGTSVPGGWLLMPRTRHAATALPDGTVLIVGGTTTDGGVLASAEVIDATTMSVTPVPGVMSVARRNASATTLVDGRVLIAGGNDGANDLASAEMFWPAGGYFFALDPASVLSVPRSGHTALLLPHNNSVLVAGGTSAGVPVTASDLFLPAEFPDPYSYGVGRFGPAAPMAAARSRAVTGPAADEGYAFVMGGGAADAEIYRFATIKTDKDDYAPGEHAVITGTGWQPGETVRLVFQEDPAVHDDYVVLVTADAEGRIYWDQWAPDWHDLDVRFYLSASDSKSRAQITFTDGFPQNVTLTPTTRTVLAGESAQFSAAVDMQGGGAQCTVTLKFSSTQLSSAFAAFEPDVRTGNDDFTSVLTIATTTVAPGSYDFTVTATKGSNCTGAPNSPSVDGTLVVTRAATTLSLMPASGTYGGTVALSAALTSGGSAVEGQTIEFLLNGTAVGSATTNDAGVAVLMDAPLSGINAGSYPAGVSAQFVATGNYLGSSATAALSVSKADANVVVNGYSGVYDGDPHNATGTASGVDGENLSGLLTFGDPFTNAPGGTATWSFAGDTNYNAANGTVAVVITKADATISVDGYTGVYDGDPHGATGSATGVKGEDLTSLLSLGASFTDVPGGTASWSFAGNTNYHATSGTAAIEISKANVTIAVEGYTGTYDGDEHGATGTAAGVKNEDLSALLDLGAKFTNAPGGTATWSFAGDTNYNAASGTAAIVISKADADITVTGYTGVYDGDAHSASGTATGVKGEDLSGLLSLGESFTNVPGGTATWSFAGDTNYNAANGTAAIEISKANATIAVEGYTGTYDGDEHGATGTATGVKGENLASLLSLGESFTDVPGGTANWSFAGNGNYNAASGTAAIVINKANATISVEGYTGTYDGDAHGATGTATGVNGEDLFEFLSLGETFTHVPGGTATWSFGGHGNYNNATGTVAIVINKANADITVTGYTGVYDGEAHSASGTATGVKGEDLSGLLSLGESFTNVPGGTATWSFAGDTNYNAANGTAAIEISKANATIAVEGYTGTYDGEAHGAIGTATGVKGEDLASLLSLGESFTDVPGGTANWSFAGNGNYNAASGTAAIVISQADADITVTGYTGVYDGNAHGATGTATGVKGEDLASLLSLGETFTDVPGGTASWSFAGDTNYKTANGTAAIVINKANAVITVNGYTGVYDGNAHGATGTATGVKGEDLTSLLTLGAQFTDAPGGTANWSFAGNGNYNDASGTAAIVIEKAWQVIAWSNPAPIVYGTPLSSAQLNAVRTTGDGALTYTPAEGAVLAVGDQQLRVVAAETTNFLETAKTVTLTVTPWHATGFYTPVTMGGPLVVNTVKGGSTVPLKFNLYTSVGGTELTNVSAIKGFTVVPMGCSSGTFEDPVEMTTTGGTVLRYDTTARQFVQNWQTPKGAGSCYRVTMTAQDGTTLNAYFKTK